MIFRVSQKILSILYYAHAALKTEKGTTSTTTTTTTMTTTTTTTTTAIPTTTAVCENPTWVGDGGCDDIGNNPTCDFDGGDCCMDPLGENSACFFCLCDYGIKTSLFGPN
jgi:hypothetical protein